MSDERPRSDPYDVTAAVPIAPVTGVATGSLGTASNLEDTQPFRNVDRDRGPSDEVVPPGEMPLDARTVDHTARPAVELVQTSRPRRRVSAYRLARQRAPFTRTTGLVAAGLAILIGGLAAIGTGTGSSGTTGPASPTDDTGAVAAPTTDTARKDNEPKGHGDEKPKHPEKPKGHDKPNDH